MKQKNELVTLIYAIAIVPPTIYIANYLRIFEETETTQSRAAKEVINIFNTTKFVPSGPVSWKLINDYKDNKCLNYTGKITWNILNFDSVHQDSVVFSTERAHQVSFVTEKNLAYDQSRGIVPRHFMKIFWSFRKNDHLYTSWKNFSIPQDSPGEIHSNIPPFCVRVLNEVRKATPQEIAEFTKIYPVKIDIHDGHWEFE